MKYFDLFSPMKQNLALNPKVRTIPILREVIMLGYGSMIAKHCAEHSACSADLLKVKLLFIHLHLCQ